MRDQIQTLQRLRVGLIGLVAVVLLIALASAIIGTTARPDVFLNDEVANRMTDNVIADAGEPLAELGAAPGSLNEQTSAAR